MEIVVNRGAFWKFVYRLMRSLINFEQEIPLRNVFSLISILIRERKLDGMEGSVMEIPPLFRVCTLTEFLWKTPASE